MNVTPYDFTIDETRCRVVEIDYQRNGVCGEGFFIVRFQCSDAPERPLIGIVVDCEADPNAFYGVIDPNDLRSHWRGDHFVDGLRAAILARSDEIWPHSVTVSTQSE